jgi:hypothetical protein
MNSGFILRIGLGIVFLSFAAFQLVAPDTYVNYLPLILQSGAAENYVYAIGAINAFLGVTIIFGLLGPIAPILGAVHLILSAFVGGFTPTSVQDIGLAIACLAIVFGNDQMPNRTRAVLADFFRKH